MPTQLLKDSDKLDRIIEMSIEHGEKVAAMEEHLKGINGFVKDQCKVNSYVLKRVNMGEGAVKLTLAAVTLYALFTIIIPALTGG